MALFYRAGCQSEWGILSQQSSCREATARHIPDIPGWDFVFQQYGALAHPARDIGAFLERKVSDFIPTTPQSSNSPDLNPVDSSIWSVLQEIVYRFRIANANELETRLIDKLARFDQSVVDAATGKWRRRLSACVRGPGTHWAPNIKFQLFYHVATKSY